MSSVAAAACALVFLAAGLGKLDSWGSWSRLADEIPGPALLGRVTRVAVPAIEGIIAVLSFKWPVVGLAVGSVVLGVFAVAVLLLARRLGGRECNCFGAIAPATISPRLAARNVVLALCAAGGAYAARQEGVHTLSLPAVVSTAIAGATGLMLLHYWRLHQAARRPAPR